MKGHSGGSNYKRKVVQFPRTKLFCDYSCSLTMSCMPSNHLHSHLYTVRRVLVQQWNRIVPRVLSLANVYVKVPGIMNHATFLDPCTNGVGYSLLMVAPSFYLLSAVLFTVLGIMIVTWTTCAHKSATVQDITSITEPLQNHTEHEVSDFVPHEKT